MKRLFALLLAILLFSAPAFSQKKDTYHVRTVVIDPGHGGAKPGAQGGRIQEKQLTLSIAKKFGKLIKDNYPDVRVIYTRTSDIDVSLAERAHIANRNKADLFISIHANSHPTAAPSGVETFVMGLSESRANLEVAKKENADILLEIDYKKNAAYDGFDPNSPETYVLLTMYQNAFLDKSLNFAQAVQNQYRQNIKTINRGVKQAELFVLYKTAMPAVLTEVGFISNPAEEDFMISDEGQAAIAISLFNAFMSYKATEEGGNIIADPKIDLPGYKKPEAPKAAPVVVVESKAESQENTPKEEPREPEPVAQEQPAQPVVVELPQPEAKPAVAQPEPSQPVAEEPAREQVKAEEVPAPVVEKPVERTEKPRVETPARPKDAKNLAAPRNTAPAEATTYYTVQFLTSTKPLPEGDYEFKGVRNAECYRNGNIYCYTLGRFATFQDAARYCTQVQANSPFGDAWVVKRKAAAEPAQKAPASTTPRATTTQPAQQPVAGRTPAPAGMVFRVQFCTVPRQMKAGDPDLCGITDFQSSRSGKYYIYTCGNYATREEAEARCATLQRTTPFKDAIVVTVKK